MYTSFAVDTPDPYIQLKVASSPSGQQKTKVCDDTKDPTWNEQFKFIIDPSKPSTLGKSPHMDKLHIPPSTIWPRLTNKV